MLLLGLAVLGLVAIVLRRVLVHWRLRRLHPLVEEWAAALATSVVTGVDPPRPGKRIERRAFRLAACELLPQLRGESRRSLTAILERMALVEEARRTLRRSPLRSARRRAADELVEIGSSTSADALERAAGDSDALVRVVSVRGLAALRLRAPTGGMLRVLARDAEAASGHCYRAMQELAEAAPESLERFQGDEVSPLARRLAVLALVDAGRARAIASLLADDLTTENPLLSFTAVKAIERIGGAAAVQALGTVAADAGRDGALRDEARRALARLEPLGGA